MWIVTIGAWTNIFAAELNGVFLLSFFLFCVGCQLQFRYLFHLTFMGFRISGNPTCQGWCPLYLIIELELYLQFLNDCGAKFVSSILEIKESFKSKLGV